MRSIPINMPRLKYEIWQIGRPFHIKFQEHFHDYKYANKKSKSAQHLLHAIGSIESIIDIIHTMGKGKMLHTMEKFHIYKVTQMNNQLNDKCTVKPNVIFETLILADSDRAHITL